MRSVTHLKADTLNLQPLEGYTLVKTVGVGTFGAVFLCNNAKGEPVAIKKVFMDPKFKSRELQLVSRLQHPNNLVYIGHKFINEGQRQHKFLILITDYLPDSLPMFMSKFPFPPPLYVKLWGYQMFSGLAYLHAHSIAHRDIKPSNVLVDPDDGRLQLCDFGSAKFLLPGEKSVSYIATRNYRAPELLLDCPAYTFSIDVWSAGCVLAELFLQGRSLFNGRNNSELLTSIVKTIGSPNPEDLESFESSKRFTQFGIKGMTLKAALPSFTPPEFIDLLEKIFIFNVKKRYTAVDCMRHPFFADLFNPGTTLPSGKPLPDYLYKMKTPEEMFRNFPNGPSPE
ncbi:CMGC family protein kinase [Trichomonas vaginalis G3]|uniref:CMGC family protein kinase n=1 Tax=Trichomonas vaginalis (strain ATCC PRA-98 / G3) TaxID=412133 RepID=A2EDY4_TRIV3|nr:STKc GSK3 domain-containing protein [Trichomonas vaginalis G3]EAY09096.1 CMGC family protein kinase [Trichomonas vaginalis G3]KAI5502672.1 STKc GSK3 domain-containing protein [Trichomonas vaginalis G3]|eukprot:XP_001321319.1 CMGC family protein kinase [Trichomonas vaginalis G3]